jgi:L-amino acid N-acyltransferase YncA
MDTLTAVTIRDAWPTDLDAVTEIYAHYVRTSAVTFELDAPDRQAWSRRFWTIAATGLPFLVAECDGEIAGYGYCSPWKQRAAYRRTVEDSIYVSPHMTGRGVGGSLLEALTDRCAALDVRQVIAVVVDIGNPASIELHRRAGFVEVGRLPAVGHKHDRWWDTVLLQRNLVAERGTA